MLVNVVSFFVLSSRRGAACRAHFTPSQFSRASCASSLQCNAEYS